MIKKFDFLVTGHDHSLQWLESEPHCGAKPQFIISGAAAKTNGPGNSSNKITDAVEKPHGLPLV